MKVIKQPLEVPMAYAFIEPKHKHSRSNGSTGKTEYIYFPSLWSYGMLTNQQITLQCFNAA